MKQISFFVLALFVLASCGNKTNSGTKIINNPHSADSSASADGSVTAVPKIVWDHTKHNFGKVYANQKVSHRFTFTNEGNTDLVLVDSRTSCGCTVPVLPEEPIKPGESSHIVVEFKKSGEGTFSKQITIVANTVPKESYLHISGNLVPED